MFLWHWFFRISLRTYLFMTLIHQNFIENIYFTTVILHNLTENICFYDTDSSEFHWEHMFLWHWLFRISLKICFMTLILHNLIENICFITLIFQILIENLYSHGNDSLECQWEHMIWWCWFSENLLESICFHANDSSEFLSGHIYSCPLFFRISLTAYSEPLLQRQHLFRKTLPL